MEVTEEEAKAKSCPVKDCKCLGRNCMAFVFYGTKCNEDGFTDYYRCGLCR